MVRYKLILRIMIRAELWRYRKANGDTQEKMAEKLHVSPRSYIDLEHGKYGVSTVTLMFFLNLLPDDEAVAVIHSFAVHAEEADENAIA